MLKTNEKPERLAILNESLGKAQGSDFQNNMKNLLMNLNSPSQTPKNIIESFHHLNLFSPISAIETQQRALQSNGDLDNIPIDRDFGHIRSPMKVPSHPENIMNSNNNNLNKTNENPVNGSRKNFKIPLLQIPTNITENCPVISRSTRRADPYKSFSTTSNRFSNSIDLAAKNAEGLMGRSGYINKNLAQDNNISIMDNENSLFFDDNMPSSNMGLPLNSGKNSNELSSSEKMKILANQLGKLIHNEK